MLAHSNYNGTSWLFGSVNALLPRHIHIQGAAAGAADHLASSMCADQLWGESSVESLLQLILTEHPQPSLVDQSPKATQEGRGCIL